MLDYSSYSDMLDVQVKMCFPFEYGFYRKIGLPNVKKVAEIGCGNARFLHFLSSFFPEPHYYGYDHDEEILKNRQETRSNVVVELGSADSILEEADILLLRLVLHQIENRKDFIQKIVNRLEAGSKLVIIDPFDEKFILSSDMRNFKKNLDLHRAALSPGKATRSVKDFLVGEMKQHGFHLDAEELYYVPSLLPGYKAMYREYMIATSKITGFYSEVENEIEEWYKNPISYAQIALFMSCFSKI